MENYAESLKILFSERIILIEEWPEKKTLIFKCPFGISSCFLFSNINDLFSDLRFLLCIKNKYKKFARENLQKN